MASGFGGGGSMVGGGIRRTTAPAASSAPAAPGMPQMPRRAAPPAMQAQPQVTMRPGMTGMGVGGQYRVFDANDTEGMHAAGWANPNDAADQRGDFYRKVKSRWRVK